jgi:hypothetical protein
VATTRVAQSASGPDVIVKEVSATEAVSRTATISGVASLWLPDA